MQESSSIGVRRSGGPLLTRWIGERLDKRLELPRRCDTFYPGFVALSANEALLTFYSSHDGSGTGLAPSAIDIVKLPQD